MASYLVMEPPVDATDRDAIAVRDGFHLLGLIFPVFWLLFHRLWLEALAVFLVTSLLGAGAAFFELPGAAFWMSLLVGLYVALEGSALRVSAMSRRGWREWGVVEAETAADAELRHDAEMLAIEPLAPAETSPWERAARAARAGPRPGPALGLFSYPGER